MDAHVFKDFVVFVRVVVNCFHPSLESFNGKHSLFVKHLSVGIESAHFCVNLVKNIKFVPGVEDCVLQFLDPDPGFVLLFLKCFKNILVTHDAVHDGVKNFLHQMSGLRLNVEPKQFKRWVLLAQPLELGGRNIICPLVTFFLLSLVKKWLLTDFSRGSFLVFSLSSLSLSGRPARSLSRSLSRSFSRSGDLPFVCLSDFSFFSRLLSDTGASLIAEFV